MVDAGQTTKKSSRIVWIIILAILILGGLGYWYYSNSKVSADVVSVIRMCSCTGSVCKPINTPIPTPTRTPTRTPILAPPYPTPTRTPTPVIAPPYPTPTHSPVVAPPYPTPTRTPVR